MGQPVVHWELWSQNPAAIAKFYQDIFAWKIEDYPQMNYRIVRTEGGGMGIDGGIMQSPQDGPGPGGMTCYIAVDDLATYRDKIVAAGGKICVEEQAVPGMGTLSLFTDPDGRMMGLWKPEMKK
jgi:predicted enzyme related to lactoylglutathione lyase